MPPLPRALIGRCAYALGTWGIESRLLWEFEQVYILLYLFIYVLFEMLIDTIHVCRPVYAVATRVLTYGCGIITAVE